ncbi:MAG: hypothetical protein R3F61_25430 [Myxococcota bacterium]
MDEPGVGSQFGAPSSRSADDHADPKSPERTQPDAVDPPEPEPFVRVLEPADHWTNKAKYTDEQREKNFRGRVDWDISVALEARCSPPRVLAALFGGRKEVALDPPAYYRFHRSEVEAVGGVLKDTPAKPPWPEDYSHAHHDVVKAHAEVAEHMASLYNEEPERVQLEEETTVLLIIAELLGRPDVQKKFKTNATYRFRRMFEDGGAERERWKLVAKEHRFLMEQATVNKAIKQLYQDPGTRPEWTTLMDDLEVVGADRSLFQ